MSISHRALCTTLLLTLLLITFASPVYAFEGRQGDNVTIAAGEVVDDDLYVAASEFTLEGTVNGDVVSATRVATINGVVHGNVVAVGQTLVVNGDVSGDILAAGSVLFFGPSAHVGGDVVGVGYSFEFRKGMAIERDAILAAGQILLASDVGRNVKVGAGALEIAGHIAGDVNALVGEANQVQAGPPPTVFFPQSTVPVPVVKQGLTIDPQAKIAGDLKYTQNSELSVPAGVVQGRVDRSDQPQGSEVSKREQSLAAKSGQWALQSLRSLITLLLIGIFLLWVVPGFLRALSDRLHSDPLRSLGWGIVAYAGFLFLVLLTLFVTIVSAIVFGLFTLGGLSAALVWVGILVLFALILGFVLATTFLAKIVFGMTLGRWVLTRAHSPLAEHRYWPMIVGVLITVAVIALLTFPLIPGFLGGLLDFGIVLFGLGALWLRLRPILGKPIAASA